MNDIGVLPAAHRSQTPQRNFFQTINCRWEVLIARYVLTALLQVVDFVCSGNALIYRFGAFFALSRAQFEITQQYRVSPRNWPVELPMAQKRQGPRAQLQKKIQPIHDRSCGTKSRPRVIALLQEPRLRNQ